VIQPSAGHHSDRKVDAEILGVIPEPMEDMVMESSGTRGPRSGRDHVFPFSWIIMIYMGSMLSMGLMLQLEWKFTNAR
tara:strand:+ start:574 stop:807 length:234 start_codon:yes stop_codon:yes gene_type:complete